MELDLEATAPFFELPPPMPHARLSYERTKPRGSKQTGTIHD